MKLLTFATRSLYRGDEIGAKVADDLGWRQGLAAFFASGAFPLGMTIVSDGRESARGFGIAISTQLACHKTYRKLTDARTTAK